MIFLHILILYINLPIIYSQSDLIHEYLILLTITNNPINTKQHQNNFLFILAVSTEQPIDN